MRASSKFVAAVLCGALAPIGSTVAQVERNSGGANSQVVMQYQQAIAEKTQLQAENARLKKESDDAKKELDGLKKSMGALKSGSGATKAALAAAQASSQEANKNLEQAKTKLQELLARYRDNVATTAGLEAERAHLQRKLAASEASLDQCAQRNVELYDISKEVLDRYEHQSIFGTMAKSEPFTRIKRTRIENIVDEYRQRVESLKLKAAPAAPPARTAPAK